MRVLHQVKDGAHQVQVVRMVPRRSFWTLLFLKRALTVARVREVGENSDNDTSLLFIKSVKSTTDIEVPPFSFFFSFFLFLLLFVIFFLDSSPLH